MDQLVLFLVATVIFAVCMLGMAVGVLIRKKEFSCGCGGASHGGDDTRCVSCPNRER